ncbi:PilZ domain-containing protein [Sneathiella aquimaris]|uniref:PilZ domain-containing protein n=1 Tax=Sneathiella aquimaris TaxID=2599305 RepID=UPI00146B2671|nr:PilZ domain-containing protein [Sneathiella aquimaris]
MIIGKDIQEMLSKLESERASAGASGETVYAENRAFRRSRVVWEAKLKLCFNQVTLKGEVREITGVVRDISANGAKVDLSEPIFEKTDLELHIPKLGMFRCNVVWQDHTRVGIQFVDNPDTIFAHLTRILPKA